MNRTYELMFIVRPDMTDEDLDKLVSTLQSVVPASGGPVQRVDKMGKRRLAYTVRPELGECDYPEIYAEPPRCVIEALRGSTSVSELDSRLPSDLT